MVAHEQAKMCVSVDVHKPVHVCVLKKHVVHVNACAHLYMVVRGFYVEFTSVCMWRCSDINLVGVCVCVLICGCLSILTLSH